MIWFAQIGLSGRLQALALVIVTLSTALFAWLGAALVALVTLRKGIREGGFLLLWGVVPTAYIYSQIGDPNPLAQLIGTFVLASILRQTVSLTLTTLFTIPLGIVFALLLLWFSSPVLDHVIAAFGDLLSSLKDQMEKAGQSLFFNTPSDRMVAGMIGVANSVAVLLCLFLARFWQAALFNPGGFGIEFRALRYSAVVAFSLAIGFAAVSNIDGYQSWAGFFGLPLTVAGIALVHAKAQFWNSRVLGLCFFYLIWLIIDLAKLFLLLFSVIDSVYDFRKNWAKTSVSAHRKDNESNDN